MAQRIGQDASALQVGGPLRSASAPACQLTFVSLRRDLARHGSHPTILFGYGLSGTNLLSEFAENIAAQVQMGGIYAVANLRGGVEFGSAWYGAAVRERKQTTFNDLIAANEHLIAQG